MPINLFNVSRCGHPLLDLCYFLFLFLPLVNIASISKNSPPSGNRDGFKDIAAVGENGVDLLQVKAAGLREEDVHALMNSQELIPSYKEMIQCTYMEK
jgi:hypothetical protein